MVLYIGNTNNFILLLISQYQLVSASYLFSVTDYINPFILLDSAYKLICLLVPNLEALGKITRTCKNTQSRYEADMKHVNKVVLHSHKMNNERIIRYTYSATGKCQLQKIWWAWATHFTEGKIIQAKVFSPW
jgi:hypothetical protein